MCILHQEKKRWLLPKGRKNYNETMGDACLRETQEETGYPCEFIPLRMPTRATEPGDIVGEDLPISRDGMTEPVGGTIEERGAKGCKLILWYVTRVKNGAVKADGTQMVFEDYESHFVAAEQAIDMLSFSQHKDIAAQAIDLVKKTEAVLKQYIV